MTGSSGSSDGSSSEVINHENMHKTGTQRNSPSMFVLHFSFRKEANRGGLCTASPHQKTN